MSTEWTVDTATIKGRVTEVEWHEDGTAVSLKMDSGEEVEMRGLPDVIVSSRTSVEITYRFKTPGVPS